MHFDGLIIKLISHEGHQEMNSKNNFLFLPNGEKSDITSLLYADKKKLNLYYLLCVE